MKRWLITGGCGFIGSRLVSVLRQDESNKICIVDDFSVAGPKELGEVTEFYQIQRSELMPEYSFSAMKSDVELVEGDILDEELALALSRNADVIVHLAANTGVGPSVENPVLDCSINVKGTLNYLEGARRADDARFVFASSGAPLGEVENPPIHEKLPARPVSPYGASKLAGEGYCSAYFGSYDVKTIALRFGNVYGPGSANKSSVVAKFIKRAMNGLPLEVYGDGSQTRDFIYIDDLVNAIVKAGTSEGVAGEVFQIATNKESTVSEIVVALENILRESGVKDIKTVFADARAGDVKRNFSDVSKAKKILGWQPEMTLDDGLRRTVRYFVESN